MRAFKDTTGRSWEITINVGTVKRVKSLCKDDAGNPVHLGKLLDDGCKPFGALLSDVSLFVDVLYVICKPQADAAGITDVTFGESLGGDSLEAAADAFREELIDFFPVAKARSSLRKMMEKGRQIGMKLIEDGDRRLEALDVDKEAERLAKTISLNSSTPTPAACA